MLSPLKGTENVGPVCIRSVNYLIGKYSCGCKRSLRVEKVVPSHSRPSFSINHWSNHPPCTAGSFCVVLLGLGLGLSSIWVCAQHICIIWAEHGQEVQTVSLPRISLNKPHKTIFNYFWFLPRHSIHLAERLKILVWQTIAKLFLRTHRNNEIIYTFLPLFTRGTTAQDYRSNNSCRLS